MLESIERIKAKYANDPEVILTPKEFVEEVRPGMEIWEIRTLHSKPTYIAKETFGKFSREGTWYYYSNLFPEYCVSDLFIGAKCVCLSFGKANKMYSEFVKAFRNDAIWQRQYRLRK